MRISDWSSDVCFRSPLALFLAIIMVMALSDSPIGFGRITLIATFALIIGAGVPLFYFNFRATRMRKKMIEQFPVALDVRSEERRVWKEGVSTCRSRWAPDL